MSRRVFKTTLGTTEKILLGTKLRTVFRTTEKFLLGTTLSRVFRTTLGTTERFL